MPASPFVHLRTHTEFSVVDGTLRIDDAVAAARADGQGALARYDSKQIGAYNMARFKLPEFDRIIERMRILPDGPERAALFDRARQLAVAYMPYKFRVNRVITDMSAARLIGYRRPVFWQDWWQYVDIDDSETGKAR